MRKYAVIMLLVILVLPACKSNLEAYNMAYQKLKDKEQRHMKQVLIKYLHLIRSRNEVNFFYDLVYVFV